MFMTIEDDEQTSAQNIIDLLEPMIPTGTLKPMDLTSLGFAYCTVGRPVDCKIYTEAGLRVGEKLNNPISQHNLALALQKNHDLHGALEHFKEAYERDPQNMTYHMDYDAIKRQIEK
jgi:hypothetical protein